MHGSANGVLWSLVGLAAVLGPGCSADGGRTNPSAGGGGGLGGEQGGAAGSAGESGLSSAGVSTANGTEAGWAGASGASESSAGSEAAGAEAGGAGESGAPSAGQSGDPGAGRGGEQGAAGGIDAGTTGSTGKGGSSAAVAGAGGAGTAGGADSAGAAALAGREGESEGTQGGGGGGEPSEAGAGGAVECHTDEDCSDGLSCNGKELCREGRCAQGFTSSPCKSPDPDHCGAFCREGLGGPECEIVALDADADGYEDALCEVAPGLDCDDADGAVYPNAPEGCDGIDNDCDGRIDLADGLDLGGVVEDLPGIARAGGVSWSPVHEQFAVVSSGPEGAHALSLSPLGEVGEEVLLLERDRDWDGADERYRAQPLVAWDRDEYLVAHVEVTCGSSGPGGVSCGGDTRIVPYLPGDTPEVPSLELAWLRDLMPAPGPGWLAAELPYGSSEVTLWKVQDGSEGLVASELTTLGRSSDVTSLRMASQTNGDAAGAFWSAIIWATSEGAVEWVCYSGDVPEEDDIEELGTEAGEVAIADLPNGFALAWISESPPTLNYELRTADGTRACGPTTIPLTDDPLISFWASVDLVHTDRGVLVLTGTDRNPEGDQLVLHRFDEECQPGDRAVVSQSADPKVWPRVAAGEGSVAVAWTEYPSTDEPTAHLRVFGDLLCSDSG